MKNPLEDALYLIKCHRAIHRGEVSVTYYRHGAVVSGWPPRWEQRSGAPRPKRGEIRSQSRRSLIRAGWAISNSNADFDMMSTLTFRLPHSDPKGCLRRWIKYALGLNTTECRYAWVQEYQQRGVVHFHVLWCWADSILGLSGLEPEFQEKTRRGTSVKVLSGYPNQALTRKWIEYVGDNSSAFWNFQMGGIHESVNNPALAGKYLGSYAAKEAQKELPDGEAPAGRWWYLSDAAQPIPERSERLTTWTANKPHKLVFDKLKMPVVQS